MTDPSPDVNMRQIALAVFGPSLLFGLGEGAIFPILALNATALGASEAWAGLIVALIGIGSLLSNIPAAILTDHFGERRAMIGAAAFSVVAIVLCIIAHSPWLLGVGTFMIGMATSVFMLARQTYLIEAIPPAMRARALSTLGGTMRIGMFVGPFLAAGVMHFVGMVGAYWVALVTMSGAGALSYFVADLAASPRERGTAAPHIDMFGLLKAHAFAYLTLGVAAALVLALRACRQIVIPLWADQIGLDATMTAIIYGIMGGVDMLLFYPAGRVMDIYGRRWIAIPSMLIMAASLVLMPWTTGVVSLLIISIALGLGNSIGSGLVMTVGADASPNLGRTQFLGIWRFIADLGTGGGPLLLSAITAALSLSAGIVFIGALGFVAAAMFWRWLPRRPTS